MLKLSSKGDWCAGQFTRERKLSTKNTEVGSAWMAVNASVGRCSLTL